MVENAILAQAHHATAGKRDVRRETPAWGQGESGSVLLLDAKSASITQPGAAAERNETRDWVRLALELLEPDDRNVILWREYEEASFAEVAARLGVAEDAARMRFARALPKLAKKLKVLRAGELDKLLQEGA
jgi:RNA polymerase sigma factor (sigma-70 family)